MLTAARAVGPATMTSAPRSDEDDDREPDAAGSSSTRSPSASQIAAVAGTGVLYFDPNPTAAKLATAGLRLAGYNVLHAGNLDQAVELCRSRGPAGDRTIAALLLDTATAPAVSAAVLRALLEVPGASELPGMLLVSRANPVPFPGAEALPSLKRPFTTPALLRFLRDSIDAAPPSKPSRARQSRDEAVLRLELALQQFFPELEPDSETLRRFHAMLTSMSELPSLASGVTIQAELGPTKLESVLEVLDADGARGVLTIEAPGARARLHVDRGRIRMAETEGDEDLRLQRFVLELGRTVDSAVVAPITVTNDNAVSDSSKSGLIRATMKMPAVTIVAAWISAEIGVGPSIESGSHTCSGTCALLPIAPTNRQMQVTVSSDQAAPAHPPTVSFTSAGAFANTAA
jgi:CheY-like chemotaxis protein